MAVGVLRVHEALRVHGRLPALEHGVGRVTALEVGLLLLLGAGAVGLTALLDFNLRLPGHAIVRAVLPLGLGMALVPRRGAGIVMSAAALATAGLFRLGGLGPGPGALTSLCLTGPFLDLALAWAKRGWHVYLGFVLGGLGANLTALVVRGGLKAFAFETPGLRPAAEWLAQSAITYPAFGILAGLVSAALWFQLRERTAAREREAPP